mmetsp:Transcript_14310/g.42211  ORF Transcript_14310/g.42211 Transcript_14310/m.42211 type:complete len:226 (-) Transcript_14310:587-1264(-)
MRVRAKSTREPLASGAMARNSRSCFGGKLSRAPKQFGGLGSANCFARRRNRSHPSFWSQTWFVTRRGMMLVHRNCPSPAFCPTASSRSCGKRRGIGLRRASSSRDCWRAAGPIALEADRTVSAVWMARRKAGGQSMFSPRPTIVVISSSPIFFAGSEPSRPAETTRYVKAWSNSFGSRGVPVMDNWASRTSLRSGSWISSERHGMSCTSMAMSCCFGTAPRKGIK